MVKELNPYEVTRALLKEALTYVSHLAEEYGGTEYGKGVSAFKEEVERHLAGRFPGLEAFGPKDHSKEISSLRDALMDSIEHSPLCAHASKGATRCYCEYEKRCTAVERLAELAARGNQISLRRF